MATRRHKTGRQSDKVGPRRRGRRSAAERGEVLAPARIARMVERLTEHGHRFSTVIPLHMEQYSISRSTAAEDYSRAVTQLSERLNATFDEKAALWEERWTDQYRKADAEGDRTSTRQLLTLYARRHKMLTQQVELSGELKVNQAAQEVEEIIRALAGGKPQAVAGGG